MIKRDSKTDALSGCIHHRPPCRGRPAKGEGFAANLEACDCGVGCFSGRWGKLNVLPVASGRTVPVLLSNPQPLSLYGLRRCSLGCCCCKMGIGSSATSGSFGWFIWWRKFCVALYHWNDRKRTHSHNVAHIHTQYLYLRCFVKSFDLWNEGISWIHQNFRIL